MFPSLFPLSHTETFAAKRLLFLLSLALIQALSILQKVRRERILVPAANIDKHGCRSISLMISKRVGGNMTRSTKAGMAGWFHSKERMTSELVKRHSF